MVLHCLFTGKIQKPMKDKRWLFVYPSLEVALDLVKDIHENVRRNEDEESLLNRCIGCSNTSYGG
jgi:hypothetical protein